MATPKKRMSHVRSGTRRGQIHLKLPDFVYCPKCHSARLPHTACGVCGTYRGRVVIDLDKKTTAETAETEHKTS